MLKRVVCATGAAVIALAPSISGAACFTEAEWQAANVRVYQTDLQVAALECANVAGHSYNDAYNTFVERFRTRLKVDANLLKAHFRRIYGRGYERRLDEYITKLANDASTRSMQDLKFCADSAGLFQSALALSVPQLEQAALAHVADPSEVGIECRMRPPVQSAAKPSAKKPKIPNPN